MNISMLEVTMPVMHAVTVSSETLTAELSDGRTLTVPLDWFPRLIHATPAERSNWRLIGRGTGVHWPDLDEDISIEALIAGRGSTESQASFQRWLEAKSSGKPQTLDALHLESTSQS